MHWSFITVPSDILDTLMHVSRPTQLGLNDTRPSSPISDDASDGLSSQSTIVQLTEKTDSVFPALVYLLMSQTDWTPMLESFLQLFTRELLGHRRFKHDVSRLPLAPYQGRPMINLSTSPCASRVSSNFFSWGFPTSCSNDPRLSLRLLQCFPTPKEHRPEWHSSFFLGWITTVNNHGCTYIRSNISDNENEWDHGIMHVKDDKAWVLPL